MWVEVQGTRIAWQRKVKDSKQKPYKNSGLYTASGEKEEKQSGWHWLRETGSAATYPYHINLDNKKDNNFKCIVLQNETSTKYTTCEVEN